ncbi:hypothetical protein ES703_96584 [subsurface metagenome]
MLIKDTIAHDLVSSEKPWNDAETLKQAWGTWLTELGDRQNGGWNWWATLTFRDPDNPALPNWTKPGWSYTEKAYNRFLAHLTFATYDNPIFWVRAREEQPWRGVSHFHSLIGGVADLPRDEAWAWWFNRYGFARIEPYNRELGAGFYLCKYVTKDLGDIQLSENLRPSERLS